MHALMEKSYRRQPGELRRFAVIVTEEHCDEAIRLLRSYPGPHLFGYDTEHMSYQPEAGLVNPRRYTQFTKYLGYTPVSLNTQSTFLAGIQVATRCGVGFVFDLNSMGGLPVSLQHFLNDQTLQKILFDASAEYMAYQASFWPADPVRDAVAEAHQNKGDPEAESASATVAEASARAGADDYATSKEGIIALKNSGHPTFTPATGFMDLSGIFNDQSGQPKSLAAVVAATCGPGVGYRLQKEKERSRGEYGYRRACKLTDVPTRANPTGVSEPITPHYKELAVGGWQDEIWNAAADALHNLDAFTGLCLTGMTEGLNIYEDTWQNVVLERVSGRLGEGPPCQNRNFIPTRHELADWRQEVTLLEDSTLGARAPEVNPTYTASELEWGQRGMPDLIRPEHWPKLLDTRIEWYWCYSNDADLKYAKTSIREIAPTRRDKLMEVTLYALREHYMEEDYHIHPWHRNLHPYIAHEGFAPGTARVYPPTIVEERSKEAKRRVLELLNHYDKEGYARYVPARQRDATGLPPPTQGDVDEIRQLGPAEETVMLSSRQRRSRFLQGSSSQQPADPAVLAQQRKIWQSAQPDVVAAEEAARVQPGPSGRRRRSSPGRPAPVTSTAAAASDDAPSTTPKKPRPTRVVPPGRDDDDVNGQQPPGVGAVRVVHLDDPGQPGADYVMEVSQAEPEAQHDMGDVISLLQSDDEESFMDQQKSPVKPQSRLQRVPGKPLQVKPHSTVSRLVHPVPPQASRRDEGWEEPVGSHRQPQRPSSRGRRADRQPADAGSHRQTRPASSSQPRHARRSDSRTPRQEDRRRSDPRSRDRRRSHDERSGDRGQPTRYIDTRRLSFEERRRRHSDQRRKSKSLSPRPVRARPAENVVQVSQERRVPRVTVPPPQPPVAPMNIPVPVTTTARTTIPMQGGFLINVPQQPQPQYRQPNTSSRDSDLSQEHLVLSLQVLGNPKGGRYTHHR